MSVRYQYENLLRAPVEYRSAIVYITTALIMLLVPQLFLIPRVIILIGASALFLRGMIRFYQGYKLQEYQLFLPQLGTFQVSTIPLLKAKNAQWIGLGFLWDGRHTQRLFDLEKPENRHLVSQRLILEANNKQTLRQKLFIKIKRLLPKIYQQKHELPLPDGGGKPEIHAVGLWEGEQDIGIYFSEQIGHSLILGQSKTGKSNLLEIELIQAIARKDNVILIDTKGNSNVLKRVYQQTGNENFPLTLVGDQFLSVYSQIIWSHHLIHFKESPDNPIKEQNFIFRYIMLLAEIIQSLGMLKEEIHTLYLSPYSILFQVLHNYLKEHHVENIDSKKDILAFYYQNSQIHSSYYSAIYELLLVSTNDLTRLLNRHKSITRMLLNSEFLQQCFASQNKIEFDSLFKSTGSLTYFNLKQLSSNTDLLPMYIQVLQEELVDSSRKKLTRFLIIADELANNLQENTIPLIETINQIKARISLYEPDIPKISKNSPNQYNSTDFFLSLFNQLIIFRSSNQYICDYLMQRQKDVYVTTTDLISGASDNSDINSEVKFSSNTTLRQTRQKTALLSLHDFASLPVGQAFCLLEGNQLYKIRIPLVTYDEDSSNNEMQSLIQHLKNTYQSSRNIQNTISNNDYSLKKKKNDDNDNNIGSASLLSHPDHFIDM